MTDTKVPQPEGLSQSLTAEKLDSLMYHVGSIASHVHDRRELVAQAINDRDEAIRKAHAAGATYHEISKATYLSRAQVQRICDMSKEAK